MTDEHAEETTPTASPIPPSTSGTDQPVQDDVPMSEEGDVASKRDSKGPAPSTIPSPQPPGSSASASAPGSSVADSVDTVTPTLGGSAQTQVNVVNRGLPPRPTTADRSSSSQQFYASLSARRHAATADNDNDSLVSRSTAQRTTFSVGGTARRPPSRSHIPAIMPAYSFYHPLRPPAVANASAAQQIPETKPLDETPEVRPDISPAVSSEGPSMHGKPSTEPLLPKPAAFRQDNSRVLHPVIEIASTRTSMLNSSQMLGNKTPTTARLPPIAILQEKNANSQSMDKTRNWQHFPGKTHYHLGGRVQFGTQYFANVGTITLLLIPTGLYFAFPYRFLVLT
jgi:hypothetical protein